MEISPISALIFDLINTAMAIGTEVFLILHLGYIGAGVWGAGIGSICVGACIINEHIDTYGDHWRDLIIKFLR